MELRAEDFGLTKKDNKKRISSVIIGIIIFLLIVVAVVIGLIYYINETKFVIYLDGAENKDLLKIIQINEEKPSEIYIPIKAISGYLGYRAYNGNYNTKSEDRNECYIQSDNEIAMFTLNSDTIFKGAEGKDKNYDSLIIDEPVIAQNGELCTTIDGIEKAFNVVIDYKIAEKRMSISTLPYLVNYYRKAVVNFGYASIDESFNNTKTILDNMLVVKDNKGKVGVLNLETRKPVLEAKYDDIYYLQYTSDFLVRDNDKMGIISKAQRTKVGLQYDSIELMDYKYGLYKVKQNDRYGVINVINGNKVINMDYEDIGIDISKFSQNNIKSRYIIAEKLIPVKQNGKWGFFDINGNRIKECKYTQLGYIAANNIAGYSLLTIPNYNMVIVGIDEKYTVMMVNGQEIWGFPFDSAYIEVLNGETSYRATYNSNIYNLVELIDKQGYGANKKDQGE